MQLTPLEAIVQRLILALEPLDGILEINGPCFSMFAQEVQDKGVDPLALTLGDVAVLLEKARLRYHRMVARVADLQAEV